MPDQIEFLANIVRLYRGEEPETTNGSASMLKEKFPDGMYVDAAGLCRVAAFPDVEARELEGRIAENVRKLVEKAGYVKWHHDRKEYFAQRHLMRSSIANRCYINY